MTEEIIVDCTGQGPKITVQGVKGPSCKALTKPLEQAFGEVKSDTETPEMREAPLKQREQSRQRQGGGL